MTLRRVNLNNARKGYTLNTMNYIATVIIELTELCVPHLAYLEIMQTQLLINSDLTIYPLAFTSACVLADRYIQGHMTVRRVSLNSVQNCDTYSAVKATIHLIYI